MSISTPLRRFAPRCLYGNQSPFPRTQARNTLFATRHASSDSKDSKDTAESNPILDQYKRDNAGKDHNQSNAIRPVAGDISSSSIFEDDRRAAKQQDSQAATDADGTQTDGKKRDPNAMLRVLDPDPNARERWERKKIIQGIRKGNRLSKEEFLMRTEREHYAKSEMIKTSTKKLGMLARQIAGKTLDEAIVQMRFSKKKAAQDVLGHLEAARDEAIVMRGMGLGQVGKEEVESGAPALNAASTDVTGTQPPAAVVSPSSPLDIQLKNGRRHTVTDTSNMFIEQAWVGRGPYGKLPDYRARGRVFIMRTPWTSLTVILKEEATRVRQWQEREAKRLKQRQEKVWVPLPDRPVQGIRGQYYSW